MDEFIDDVNKGSEWVFKYGVWFSVKNYSKSLDGKEAAVLEYLEQKQVFPKGGRVKIRLCLNKYYVQWRGNEKLVLQSLKHASSAGRVEYKAYPPSAYEDDTDFESS